MLVVNNEGLLYGVAHSSIRLIFSEFTDNTSVRTLGYLYRGISVSSTALWSCNMRQGSLVIRSLMVAAVSEPSKPVQQVKCVI